MKGPETVLTDPEGNDEPRKFAFDFSYWSFDGSKKLDNGYYGADTSHPNGKIFCDQVGDQTSGLTVQSYQAGHTDRYVTWKSESINDV